MPLWVGLVCGCGGRRGEGDVPGFERAGGLEIFELEEDSASTI